MTYYNLISDESTFVLLCAFACAGKDTHPITKRRIAQVTEPASADWLMRPERKAEEHPDGALDAIVIPLGGSVADVGAGVATSLGSWAKAWSAGSRVRAPECA